MKCGQRKKNDRGGGKSPKTTPSKGGFMYGGTGAPDPESAQTEQTERLTFDPKFWGKPEPTTKP